MAIPPAVAVATLMNVRLFIKMFSSSFGKISAATGAGQANWGQECTRQLARRAQKSRHDAFSRTAKNAKGLADVFIMTNRALDPSAVFRGLFHCLSQVFAFRFVKEKFENTTNRPLVLNGRPTAPSFDFNPV
jgi:hypothetical protein